MKKLKILLTNDDGIKALGLRTLWEALKDIADLTIVAPKEEQSGKAVSVTFHGPLRAERLCLSVDSLGATQEKSLRQQ